MAKFDSILTPATNLASRLISAQLKRQAPVKTGALKRSTKVKTEREEVDGEYIFTYNFDYLGYGIYTDLGTGQYAVDEDRRREWNPAPGKGKGGIKPRFWTTIEQSVSDRVGDLLTDASQRALIRDLENELEDEN